MIWKEIEGNIKVRGYFSMASPSKNNHERIILKKGARRVFATGVARRKHTPSLLFEKIPTNLDSCDKIILNN